MRNPTTHILLTGATGYIGGSVLTNLLSHKLSDTFGITVLVRDAAKVKEFRTLGVKAVVGTYSDLDLLQRLASDADVVFACADADNLDAAEAILAGQKNRYEKLRTPPTLIHTSGTGVLVDKAKGQYAGTDVYSDLDLRKLESLPDSQPHRNVDLTLVDADKQGYVRTYIVLPGTIYGLATGPLVDLELQHAHSQQLPTMINIALERGEAGYVGLGKNIWPHVHIREVADLYTLIFDRIISRKDIGHGREGFYFAENGEYVEWNISKAVAQTLHDAGKLKSSAPSSYTGEEMQHFFPNGTLFGTNSRCKAERSRAIGWRPRKGYQDLVASIKGEIGSRR